MRLFCSLWLVIKHSIRIVKKIALYKSESILRQYNEHVCQGDRHYKKGQALHSTVLLRICIVGQLDEHMYYHLKALGPLHDITQLIREYIIPFK